MPRQVRIQFPGALYHVMCRGDRREPIFEDDEDCEMFLRMLGEGAKKTGWRIHAYVLMSNHYHLLVGTPEPNLVKGMTWFQLTYTVRSAQEKRSSVWRALQSGACGGRCPRGLFQDTLGLHPS